MSNNIIDFVQTITTLTGASYKKQKNIGALCEMFADANPSEKLLIFTITLFDATATSSPLEIYRTKEIIYVVVVVVQFFLNPVLSPNNRGSRIYIILVEIVLTPNLHLERLLALLVFSPTFLLCSIATFSLVFSGLPLFLVPFTFRFKFTIPLIFRGNFFLQSKSWHSLNFSHPILVLDCTVASHPPPMFILLPRYEKSAAVSTTSCNISF